MSERIPALQALRAFEVAARYGSFTRAAQELALTQGAISHHIKTLEGLFDCALFERRGPKLALTEPGRTLAQELKVGFKIIDNACAVLKKDRNGIRLKAPSTLTMRWLLEGLGQYRQAAPQSRVQLSSVWMDIDCVDFYSEPYDAAILLADGRFGPDVDSLKLFDEWLLPVCSPAYQALIETGIAGLQRAEHLHCSADRRDWRRWLARVGASPSGGERGQLFDTLDQGMSAAQQDAGVAVVDLLLARGELDAGRLVAPVPQAVSTGEGYYLTWLTSSPQARQVQALGDFLLARVPQLPLLGIDYLYD
ncbi:MULTISPECIES: LysR substrate-binding domain-containing protein [Pseudomonas]|uniref:LysR substrate-binding domain-containing protein n=1 Tax=Pseudomonas sp. Hg7Tf TaxID=3236988 RepID=A0AB39I6X2_9PSED|nr:MULTISPECIES: LysR substrate-binding domain-containing protein [unclassified Pseudomonas]KJK08290.1 LysR family transcriptional regulator [Pseudomonas sp. 5]MDH2562117.1 LysR substrate-binding domain-containing protein [Pseudomonas sp. Hg5Tf]QYX49257.1 LysR family transcriptional regulator [Pseudomonas sp. S11A 273]